MCLEVGWTVELAQVRVQWRTLVQLCRLRGPGCEARGKRVFFQTSRIMKYDLTEERLTCCSQHDKLLGLFTFCTFTLRHYQSYW
jgi:hypothetical protein